MRCDRCGETMRPETVIKLRRSLGRVRATQAPGVWCAHCGTSQLLGGRTAAEPRLPLAGWVRHALTAATVSRGACP